MANDYLAMYLDITFDLGDAGVPVAIRHFSSSTARLSEAITNGKLFTELHAVKDEGSSAAARGELVVLLDSTLPGRKNILPRPAQLNMLKVFSKLNAIQNPPQSTPRIGGPKVSSFSIRCGIRNIILPRPYNRGWADNSTFKSGVFDISTSGGVQFEILPAVVDNNLFLALKFHHWDRILLVNW